MHLASKAVDRVVEVVQLGLSRVVLILDSLGQVVESTSELVCMLSGSSSIVIFVLILDDKDTKRVRLD